MSRDFEMTSKIDFSIQEAGCLLYVADRNFGDECFTRLDDFFSGAAGLKDLILRGAIMAMSLYQDDGCSVRVRFGEDLTTPEKAEWTSRVAWRLNLESGKMVVSGVIPEDDELSEFTEAAESNGEFGCQIEFPPSEEGLDCWETNFGGEYELGCLIKIPAGEYAVTIYSYPPNDLAGGWMRIERRDLFKACFGAESNAPFEKPLDYFTRTRPSETPPDWIKDGFECASFLDFLIHLAPLAAGAELEIPEFEPDGCLAWQYRKPEICPVGIRLEEN